MKGAIYDQRSRWTRHIGHCIIIKTYRKEQFMRRFDLFGGGADF